MQGFRQYLKDIEEEQNAYIDRLCAAYAENQISDNTYVQFMRSVNGRKIMLDNISREYERTHKIWE